MRHRVSHHFRQTENFREFRLFLKNLRLVRKPERFIRKNREFLRSKKHMGKMPPTLLNKGESGLHRSGKRNVRTQKNRLTFGETVPFIFKVAGWTRLELATSCVTGRRSNQLNYHPSG